VSDVLGYGLIVVGALVVLAGLLYWAPRPSELDRPGPLAQPPFRCAECGAELMAQCHAVAGVIRHEGGRRIVESVRSAQLTLHCPNGHDATVMAGRPFGVVKDVKVEPDGRILAQIDLERGDPPVAKIRLPRRIDRIWNTVRVR
jgi:hypothetical protein